MGTHILTERIELLENTLDRDARTVEAILIRPGWSANGRYYSKSALAKSAPLFEGAKAYANHPTRDQLKRGETRDVRDLTGQYTNVRIGESGELRATRRVLHTPSGDAVWSLITESVGNPHPLIGVSINALGKASKGEADGKEGIIVESIDVVNSADDVDAPAAGGGFEQLIAGQDGPTLIADLLSTLTYDEYVEARPDIVQALRKQLKRARQDDAVRALTEERDAAQTALTEANAKIGKLQSQLDTTRAEGARSKLMQGADAILAECKFDKPYENLLRSQLQTMPPDQWVAFMQIERDKAHVARLGRKPVSVHGVPLREAETIRQATSDNTPIDPTQFEDAHAMQREVERRKAAKG